MFRRTFPPASLRAIWPQGAVLVGGAARDLLRRSAPNDWDWATPDPRRAAETLAATLGGAVFALDEQRGYFRVTVPAGAGTEARQHDLVPLPSRLEDDLLRRDFTVNALALHKDGTVTDPSGGQRDLRARRLRMVSEANLRADPLRLLRAARLSVTLGFELEVQTREAVMRLARDPSLPLPAPERVREELHALLLHPQAARGVRLLEELGLLPLYLPELSECRGVSQGGFHHLDVFRHSVEALHQLLGRFPDAPLALRWAMLLHDIGKPPTREEANGQVRYSGHERVGAEMARRRLKQLREPRALTDEVAALEQLPVERWKRCTSVTPSPTALTRYLRDPDRHENVSRSFVNCSNRGPHAAAAGKRARGQAVRSPPPRPAARSAGPDAGRPRGGAWAGQQ